MKLLWHSKRKAKNKVGRCRGSHTEHAEPVKRSGWSEKYHTDQWFCPRCGRCVETKVYEKAYLKDGKWILII